MRLKLPPRFWQDHYERCASHPGERTLITQAKDYVVVELDPTALDDLKSDADYYSDGTDMDPDRWTRGLVASARATVVAIKKQGG